MYINSNSSFTTATSVYIDLIKYHLLILIYLFIALNRDNFIKIRTAWPFGMLSVSLVMSHIFFLH